MSVDKILRLLHSTNREDVALGYEYLKEAYTTYRSRWTLLQQNRLILTEIEDTDKIEVLISSLQHDGLVILEFPL